MIVFDFTGRHAVVTGAGGGMGEAIALALLDAGASVTAIDIKPRPVSLAAHDDRLTFAQGDLTDAAFVERTIGAAGRDRGRIDYLANVAGVLWFGRDKSALEMDLDVWDQVFNINLKSFVHTARAVVPYMRAGGRGGAMVHFSTIQWYRGDPKPQDAYQASKAGVCALSKSLAMQLAGERIRSNAICPGMALTPLQARWDTEEKRAAVADYTPLGRIGTPQDMANAALFLLSDAASYITGIELAVDGGLLMRM
ncbi:SDR family oxidoreductase [bacterium M00.F.Ca.ET.159.01.1.1]|nr:SDR family oxidoreductase [bacterium M00.F.Ca.ET.159.01.1.1]TGT86720.1 SDR family oxidoreductase [bacterium M00.F.Ca.ET.157.01.1.1]